MSTRTVFLSRACLSLACVGGAAALEGACASSEEEFFTAPFRTAPAGRDVDASLPSPPEIPPPDDTSEPIPGTGEPLPPPPTVGGGPVGSCDPAFCPGGQFGVPCCTPDEQCGVDFGLGCIQLSTDGGGAGGGGGGGAPPIEVNCESNADCADGQVCCGVIDADSYTVFECRDSCESGNTTAACAGPNDCADGGLCCGSRPGGGLTPYSSLECAASCSGADESVRCSSDEDCTGGTSCQPSLVLPQEFTVCR